MPALPEHLDKVRKSAGEALRPLVDSACGASDDALFDLSQNGPTDEQGGYFTAMRDVRLQRKDILESVLAGVDRDFQALAREVVEEKKSGDGYSLDSLTLLDDDALDISVAFQGMAARSRDALANVLDHLRQRITLVLQREVPVERVPLHPERICEHFRLAIEPMVIPLKARLILIKHFERQVLAALGDVIAQANGTLAKAGYLPDIKQPKARPSASRSASGAHADRSDDELGEDNADDSSRYQSRGGGGGYDHASVSGAFGELLAMARATMMPGGGFAGGTGHPGMLVGGGQAGMGGGEMMPIPFAQLPAGQMPVMYGNQMMVGGQVVQSDVPVQVVAPMELANLLTQLQRLQQTPAHTAAGLNSGEREIDGEVIEHLELGTVDVKSGLSELIRGDEEATPRALDAGDNDVINLVSMLFDFILDDADLSSEMKALIGRLQIPLLKVSLLDKTFFDRDDHPARELLNALARAGMGWSRQSDDGLYAKMESVVFTILNDFTDDIGIFETLQADLATFVAEREKRMAMIEARLRDREEGQAKGVIAQDKVREVIAARISGRKLPPVVIRIIQDAWQRVLHHTAIREGIDSEDWQQRVKVLDVLVWCSVSHEKEDARARQRGLVPRLLVSLRRGLDAIGFDNLRAETMISELKPELEKLGLGTTTRAVRVVSEVVSPEKSAKDKPAAPSGVFEAMQVVRSSEDEIVIAAPAPAPVPAEMADERWLQTADSLAPGTWLEFHDDENNFQVRGKIAARIRAQNKYIFVNSRGVKIAEKTVEQLAHDLQTGVARLVSDAALFDRALETMIARLKTGVPS